MNQARDEGPDLESRIYGELRQLADHYVAREPSGLTLSPTALVHEAWLRLRREDSSVLDHERRFFSAAAVAMRRILVERARRVGRERHGGGRQRVDLETWGPAPDVRPGEILALDEALEELRAVRARAVEVVELRFFGGLEMAALARVLGVSEATAKREWRFARAWLGRRLREA